MFTLFLITLYFFFFSVISPGIAVYIFFVCVCVKLLFQMFTVVVQLKTTVCCHTRAHLHNQSHQRRAAGHFYIVYILLYAFTCRSWRSLHSACCAAFCCLLLWKVKPHFTSVFAELLSTVLCRWIFCVSDTFRCITLSLSHTHFPPSCVCVCVPALDGFWWWFASMVRPCAFPFPSTRLHWFALYRLFIEMLANSTCFKLNAME